VETIVHIGEVKLGLPGHTMSALLGSCVGIALLDRSTGCCTLSHSLLPMAPAEAPNTAGRWVDQSIRCALTLMNLYPNNTAHLEAVVAGGSNMLHGLKNPNIQVGSTNVDIAQAQLKHHKIKLARIDILGSFGRRMTIDVDQVAVNIETIPRIQTKRAEHG